MVFDKVSTRLQYFQILSKAFILLISSSELLINDQIVGDIIFELLDVIIREIYLLTSLHYKLMNREIAKMGGYDNEFCTNSDFSIVLI